MNEDIRNWLTSSRTKQFSAIFKTEEIFESLIIKIATGAIAISFSFVSAMSALIQYQYFEILGIGWLCLVACIIVNILSHLALKKRARATIKSIDDLLENDDTNELQVQIEATNIRDGIDKNNKVLDNCYNKPTAWLLVVGISAVLVFLIVNTINNQNIVTESEATIIKIENTKQLENSIDSLCNANSSIITINK